MGYTHYWTFTAPKRGETAKVEKVYQAAIKECAKIARAYYQANGGLSGYTAHSPIGEYGGLLINGKGDDAHEDFSIRAFFKENLHPDNWHFCKTARKPYDTVVVACLIVLTNRLPNNFKVSSDGFAHDWQEGLELAQRVLKRKILTIPKTIDVNVKYELIQGGKL
jgi:hypothetical protein